MLYFQTVTGDPKTLDDSGEEVNRCGMEACASG